MTTELRIGIFQSCWNFICRETWITREEWEARHSSLLKIWQSVTKCGVASRGIWTLCPNFVHQYVHTQKNSESPALRFAFVVAGVPVLLWTLGVARAAHCVDSQERDPRGWWGTVVVCFPVVFFAISSKILRFLRRCRPFFVHTRSIPWLFL
jgi:hypothetical protein